MDIVAILSALPDLGAFRFDFSRQLGDALSASGRPLPGTEARPQPDQREGVPTQGWPCHLRQFGAGVALKDRVVGIFASYFRDALSPGLLLYEEALAADIPAGRESRATVAAELQRVLRLTAQLLFAPAPSVPELPAPPRP